MSYMFCGCLLLASENEMELQFHLVPASKQPQKMFDIYLMLYVQS